MSTATEAYTDPVAAMPPIMTEMRDAVARQQAAADTVNMQRMREAQGPTAPPPNRRDPYTGPDPGRPVTWGTTTVAPYPNVTTGGYVPVTTGQDWGQDIIQTGAGQAWGGNTISRCSRVTHHFTCRHELRCECGQVMRDPALTVADGL